MYVKAPSEYNWNFEGCVGSNCTDLVFLPLSTSPGLWIYNGRAELGEEDKTEGSLATTHPEIGPSTQVGPPHKAGGAGVPGLLQQR